MSDDDLIRRGDALAVLSDEIDLARIAMPQAVPILSADRRAIAALPAVQPAPDVVAHGPDKDGFGTLIFEAKVEAEKAMRKFPQPNYVISKIAEEAGEVVKAAIHCAEGRETAEHLRGEMKQVIAMLYRLWIEGDQVHGLPPVRAALAKLEGRA